MRGEEGGEFAWNTWHLCTSSTRPLFLGLAGKRFGARVENVYRRKTASCECLCLPFLLSLSFSVSSSAGWFNRETRNEKSAGTRSAKLRPILVVDSTPPPQLCRYSDRNELRQTFPDFSFSYPRTYVPAYVLSRMWEKRIRNPRDKTGRYTKLTEYFHRHCVSLIRFT